MCGIAGFLDQRAEAPPARLQEGIARAMADSLAHRGPDDGDIWQDEARGLALVHRRLSIVDLSPAGHQPMVSACGRYVIVYNGEVYSHEQIRPALQQRGIVFRGHSDTEVILESCAAFGVEETVNQLIGMFAFALWDRQTATLTLVRDRLGIKPLYWGRSGALLVFGSELKALRQHPCFPAEIDRASVVSFLRHDYIPAPHSIWKHIHKLEPGCILTIAPGLEPQIHRFWDARQVAATAAGQRWSGSPQEAVTALEALLTDAVSRRMVADVPLGAFLSGGIDSSLVVALMQARGGAAVKTFSIGFDTPAFDEAPWARAVARHLGTDHTELYATAAEARGVIPSLADWFDEPFADPSQIPTYLVSAMTRRHVTVALSGDGGDELFAGYRRYQMTRALWGKLRRLPRSLRALAGAGILAIPPAGWDRLAALLPSAPAQAGDRLHKGAPLLAMVDEQALYDGLTSHWDDPAAVVIGGEERPSRWRDSDWQQQTAGITDSVERMQLCDLLSYLPDDVLTKVDRASMAVGLEARVPLLDHRVVDFAFRLPPEMKLRQGVSKWPLRQILYRHVPPELIERPKSGFGVPMADWLRGPLRDWAESLLSEHSLKEGGLLHPAPVRALWEQHQSGRRNWHYRLWNVLMLVSWQQRHGRTAAGC